MIEDYESFRRNNKAPLKQKPAKYLTDFINTLPKEYHSAEIRDQLDDFFSRIHNSYNTDASAAKNWIVAGGVCGTLVGCISLKLLAGGYISEAVGIVALFPLFYYSGRKLIRRFCFSNPARKNIELFSKRFQRIDEIKALESYDRSENEFFGKFDEKKLLEK